MVHVVDNRAKIMGTVLAIEGHPRLPGFHLITLQLEESEPVEDMLDLMTPLKGQEVPLAVRRGALGTAHPGAHLSCLAKRTADGAMCVPGPIGAEDVYLREV